MREPFEGINYHALLHMISTADGGLRPTMPGPSSIHDSNKFVLRSLIYFHPLSHPAGAVDWEGEVLEEPALGWRQLMEDCWAEDPVVRPTFKQVTRSFPTMLLNFQVNYYQVRFFAGRWETR